MLVGVVLLHADAIKNCLLSTCRHKTVFEKRETVITHSVTIRFGAGEWGGQYIAWTCHLTSGAGEWGKGVIRGEGREGGVIITSVLHVT